MKQKQLKQIENTISNMHDKLSKLTTINADLLDLDTYCILNQAIARLDEARCLLLRNTD